MGNRDEEVVVVGEVETAYLLPNCLTEGNGVETGRRMRFVGGDVKEEDG